MSFCPALSNISIPVLPYLQLIPVSQWLFSYLVNVYSLCTQAAVYKQQSRCQWSQYPSVRSGDANHLSWRVTPLQLQPNHTSLGHREQEWSFRGTGKEWKRVEKSGKEWKRVESSPWIFWTQHLTPLLWFSGGFLSFQFVLQPLNKWILFLPDRRHKDSWELDFTTNFEQLITFPC